MPSRSITIFENPVKDRVVRAVPSITLVLAVMALVAYAFGHFTRSDWVWWLPPLTVALEGTRFIRADLRNGTAILSSSADSIDADPEVYVASCAMATGMGVWGVYAGNRLAILIGTAVAVVLNTLDWGEQPVSESPRRADTTSCCNCQARRPAYP